MGDFFSYDFDISNITLAVMVAKNSGQRVHRNRPSHGLVYILGGEYHYHFQQGCDLKVCEGSLLYLPKFSNYEVDSTYAEECIAINFNLHDPDITFPQFKTTLHQRGHLTSLFSNAENLWLSKPKGYLLQCKSILYSILYLLLRADAGPPESADKRLQLVDTWVREHYTIAGAVTVKAMARQAGITPEHLRVLFRRAYGCTPTEYITSLRIARAQELLRSGMFTVAQTAEMCGYNDVAYFCREFKRATLSTPGEFRRRATSPYFSA